MLQDQILIDFISDIQACGSLYSSYQLFHERVTQLGTIDTIYAQSLGDLDSAVAMSSYRPEFIEAYKQAGGPKHDISVAWTQSSEDVLIWPDVPAEFVTDQFTTIDEIAADCGMINGVTVPMLTNSRLTCDSVGLCSTGISEKEFQSSVKPNLQSIVSLTQVFDIQARTYSGNELMERDAFNYVSALRREELETVHWLAAGYSLQKIADEKLYHSIESINLYVREAKKKLNARTRDQLVAKAIMLNLVS